MYSLFVLLLLCSPIPTMASKRMKMRGTHEKNKLHDHQSNRIGRDKEVRAARRKKFVPPPQKIQETEDLKEEEAV